MDAQRTRIKISVPGTSGEVVRDWISESTKGEAAIHIEVSPVSPFDPPFRLRGLDPAVTIATLTATGTLLGVLVNAILKFSLEYKRERVTIETRDGRRIEVEAVKAIEKVDELVSQIQQLESSQFSILVGDEPEKLGEESE